MIEVNFIWSVQAGSDSIKLAVFLHEGSMGVDFDFILGKKKNTWMFLLAFFFSLKVYLAINKPN